jgi:hypothetical protein
LEKKPPVGVWEPGCSGVGVRGAAVTLKSLLGPMFEPDPERNLLCDIILPECETATLGVDPEEAEERLLELCESVGVGGVLTMMGAGESEEGGVCGRTFVSMCVLGRRVRSGVVTLASFGSDRRGRLLSDCLGATEGIE